MKGRRCRAGVSVTELGDRSRDRTPPGQAPAKKPPVAAASRTPGEAPASVEQLEAAVKRDPGNPNAARRAGPGILGPERLPARAERLPARREGWTVVRRGAQLAGRRALGEVRSSGRDRRVEKGRRARSEVRARLHEPRRGAGQERRLCRGGGGVSRRRWPSSRTAWPLTSNLGMALREKGDLEAALEHLRRVAAGDPDNAGVHYELGQTLRQSGDLAGAVAAFEKALEIDPELREGYYGLGQALKQQSASLAQAAASRPKSPADDLFTARAGIRRARRARAPPASSSPRRIRLDENHAEAHNLLGFMLGQQGDLPSALGHLERAIALRPESAEAHYNLGVALWYSGAKDRAVTELRESVTARSRGRRQLRVSRNRAARDGRSGRRAGEPAARDRASAADGGGLRRSGHHLSSHRRRRQGAGPARSRAEPPLAVGSDAGLGRRHRWTPAGAGCRTRPGPTRTTSLVCCSVARAPTAPTVAAEFREAIRLRPDFAEAHNNLGLVLIQAGDDQAGIAALREAVRLGPDYADAHANLGAALTPTDADEADS